MWSKCEHEMSHPNLISKIMWFFFVLAHEGKEHVQGSKKIYNTSYGGITFCAIW